MKQYKRGDVVLHVPAHANKNVLHEDCQIGVVTTTTEDYATCRFLKHRGLPPNYATGSSLANNLEEKGKAIAHGDLVRVTDVLNPVVVNNALKQLGF